uniref:Uncharacterized protein n=1 Tax=Haemonchus contortus TaxID=6289 RepID=A0A7I5E9B4_HAECO
MLLHAKGRFTIAPLIQRSTTSNPKWSHNNRTKEDTPNPHRAKCTSSNTAHNPSRMEEAMDGLFKVYNLQKQILHELQPQANALQDDPYAQAMQPGPR